LDDTDNIKKSLAQILLFKEKETVLAMLWRILQPMKSKKINVKT
jgi:hypothetical protein